MNYRVYYNRCNNDKSKFTDIVVMSKARLHKLMKLSWITVCKIAPVDEPRRIYFTVCSDNQFCGDMREIRPLSINGWH
ncbi:MAG: hypothetical protein PHN69_08125 [Candidatus Pacebacteria bacterium]|nr:hypothetical protein [Candidatus Paceibacterota bacterium]